MATLTATSFSANSSTGIAFGHVLSTVSSSNGDAFSNTGAQVVLFQNSSSQGAGSTVTVTVKAQQQDNYGGAASTHNVTIAIPSSSFGITAIGPFRPSLFNDSNSLVQMTYDNPGLQIAVVQMAQQS